MANMTRIGRRDQMARLLARSPSPLTVGQIARRMDIVRTYVWRILSENSHLFKVADHNPLGQGERWTVTGPYEKKGQ